MYLKRNEVEQYVSKLTEVVEKMSIDYAHIFTMFGISMNEEQLQDLYFMFVEGPSVLEQILIKEGSISPEVCKNNPVADMLISRIAKMLDGPTENLNLESAPKFCPYCGLELATRDNSENPGSNKKVCLNCGWLY